MNQSLQSAEAGALSMPIPNQRHAVPSRHIPSLDGLRALSFMMVFLAHVGLAGVIPGGFGVTVFFFLSGFLITTLLRTEYDRHDSINFKHFWLRRSLRILPPFYLVLLTATVAALFFASPGGVSIAALGAQAFQLTNYWIIYHGEAGLPAHGGTGVFWSLCVEEHFYLLFPWVYAVMRRAKLSGSRQASILLVSCIAILVWRCVLVMWFDASSERTYMGTDTRIDSILFGCILAVFHNPTLDRCDVHESRWKYLYVPLAVTALLVSFALRQDAFRETLRYSIQGVALMPIFVAAIRFPHWWPFRMLNLKPMIFIGLLSYSLYLIHYGVLFFVQSHFESANWVLQGFLAFALSMLVAWLIYVFIEKPCARLRRRLTD